MRSQSPGSSRPWRHTHHPVRDRPLASLPLHPARTNCPVGLQTPRLKRLAEIVSAQAMAQQEKLEMENGVLEE